MLNGGFRLGDLTVVVMLLVNLVAAVWFAAQLSARVSAVEGAIITLTSNINRLDIAREATDLHLTKVDDTYTELNGKIGLVIEMLKEMAGDPTAPPSQPEGKPQPNFPHRK